MSLASPFFSTWSSNLARRSLTALSCSGVFQNVSPPGSCLTNYQQNRFKQKKIRFKTLKPIKEKKYQPKISFQYKKLVKRKINPEFEARRPTDNIWLQKFYPVQRLTLEEIVLKHKAYAHPMMLDNLEGLLYADMELNMESKKKTKFLSAVKGSLVYPHLFEGSTTARCIFLTKDPANVAEALSSGATHAGGQDLLDMLKSDALTRNMYDYVTCTPDIYPDLLTYRHIFKEKFPHQKQGTISTDVKAMVTNVINSVRYESKKTSEETATMQVPFGKLNMEIEDLLENFNKLVNKLCANRSPNLKPLLTEVKIIAPPSKEVLHLQVRKYVPGYDVPKEKAEEANEETTTTKDTEDDEDESKDVAVVN